MNIQTGITHPETGWWVPATPLWLALAAVLVLTLLLRGRLALTLRAYLARRATPGGAEAPEGALRWTPPVATPTHVLLCGGGAVLLLLPLMRLIAPLFVALVLAGPLTVVLIWGLLWALEQRYRARLEHALPAAVGRLGVALRSGHGFQHALETLLEDLPPGPLRSEWRFLRDRLGTPLTSGTLATPALVVAALASQTPSLRHASFLDHVAVALDQTHAVLVQRVQAAAAALQASAIRRSAAATELAQMRYSGIAIGLAAMLLAGYLVLTQRERVVQAYSGPLGLAVGLLMALVFLAPILGGILLARVEDLDY